MISYDETNGNKYNVPVPQTIEGIVSLRMYEMKVNQAQMAKILGVTEAKLSRILNGKMNVDVAFLKALHEKLDINAEFLLANA